MLGDFGVERPAVDESFGYFGAVIRVNPDISDLGIVEMFRSIPKVDVASAIDLMPSMARTLVHADDVDEFLRIAVANRQTIEDVVMIGLKLIEAMTARPTRLPSGSSDGQPTTGLSSTDDSSLRALRLLEGRPDLQASIVRRRAASA